MAAVPAGKQSQVMLVTFLVVAYSLCSSMLLILNKVRLAAVALCAHTKFSEASPRCYMIKSE